MNAAKVQLSAEEMTLVCDPSWILTKNAVINKVVALLAALSDQYQAVYSPLIRSDGYGGHATYDGLAVRGLHPTQPPKISKGENYRGLPYVMLDYPRIFGREHVFAIRTMFWWGHYFSVTLHLKGMYKELYGPVIGRHIIGLSGGLTGGLATRGFHLGISEEEWRHELTGDNYIPLNTSTPILIEKTLREHPFLKLSATCGLNRWDEAEQTLHELFVMLVQCLAC